MYQTLSIIVPFFNEEKTIGIVLEKVINADSCGLKKEIILVDDASTDKSNVVVSSKLKVTRRNSGIVSIKIVQFENNMGKGAAVKAGLQKATGDIVLIQDADLEYDPADYPMLLSPHPLGPSRCCIRLAVCGHAAAAGFVFLALCREYVSYDTF